MRLHFVIGLLFIICASVNASNAYHVNDTFSASTNLTTMDSLKVLSENPSSNYSNMNLPPSTNQNNKQSMVPIVIGLLSIIVSLSITLFSIKREGVKELKNDMTKLKEDVEKERDRINTLDKTINEKLNDFVGKQDYQNRYLQKINQCLFLITHSIVDLNKSNSSVNNRRILEIVYRNYYKVVLFLPMSPESKAAIDYLNNYATTEDIEDLKLIVEKDSDADKRTKASEIIGSINNRAINGQA